MSSKETTRFVRYSHQGVVSYGELQGDTVLELEGDLFSSPVASGRSIPLSDVRLLAPCQPSKVIAVGLNYRSHLGGRPEPQVPGLFAKFPTCIIACDDPIVIPADAETVHYEGELVIVIGKETKNVSVAEASDHVFGVTAGNDVSERVWQRGDLQWVRAKGSDTFGPLGPAIATGLDHNDLLVQSRLNGEVRQSERTVDLINSIETIVSYASRYITFFPGDVIFTGTPGTTDAMVPGDVVEVDVEGVGVLRNPVVAA